MREDFFNITLENMQYGWMNLRFQAENVDESLFFDALLSDPLPAFIEALNRLDSEWVHDHHYNFEFIKKTVDDKYVNIIIKAHEYEWVDDDDFDEEDEGKPLEVNIDVCITKERYKEIIDDLCASILAAPEYPYQYPLPSEDFEDSDLGHEIADEIFDCLPQNVRDEDKNEDLYVRILSICNKYMLKKTPQGEELYKTYTTMLRDKIVPKKWY